MSAKSRNASPSLLLGPGPRTEELDPVLRALGARSVDRLEDLVDTLTLGSGPGCIVLDVDHVPDEDLGILRRFLGRDDGWRIVLVGADPRARVAKQLLATPGAGWLPWPPDLDQLKALIAGADGAGEREHQHAARRRSPAPESDADEPVHELEPHASTAASTADTGGDEEFDLGGLLEEILAGVAVGGGDAPRFLFRASGGPLTISGDRGVWGIALEALFHATRQCAGAGSVIQVRARAAGGSPELSASFPAGGAEEIVAALGATPDEVADADPGLVALAEACRDPARARRRDGRGARGREPRSDRRAGPRTGQRLTETP